MTKPSLTDVFGVGAKQDTSNLTIPMASLASVGLTSKANEDAEALVVALLLLLQKNLTQDNYNNNMDQATYFEPGYSNLTTRGTDNTPYRVDQITANFAKPDRAKTIDPNDY